MALVKYDVVSPTISVMASSSVSSSSSSSSSATTASTSPTILLSSTSSSTIALTTSSLFSITSVSSGLPTTTSPALSSTTSHSAPTQHRSQQYSGGTVAGIVIPVALIVAVLAILGTWFYLRKRRFRDSESLTLVSVQPKTNDRSGGTGDYTSMVNLEDILHQQSDHSTIKNTVETLRDLIRQYVDNYVHTNGITNPKLCSSNIEDAISEFFGKDPSEKASSLARLLVSPKTRRDAMRHIFASTFLSSIEFSGQWSHSLLPREIVDLIRKFPEQKTHEKAALIAFSKWRCMTAFLLSPPGAPIATQSGHGSTMIIEFLERITKPFVDKHNEEREDILAALLKRAANMGMLLFEQPIAWRFEWENPVSSSQQAGTRRKSVQGQHLIVVFPALVDGGEADGAMKRPLVDQVFSE